MVKRDPVTPEVYARVIQRDQAEVERWLESQLRAGAPTAVLGLHHQIICVAPIVDPNELGRCWGRTTIDHIKTQPRLSKRAESDIDHLVSLCEGHTENGMQAGRQWNTANRPLLRKYIKEANERLATGRPRSR